MTYKLILENHTGYLVARVTGENTADNVARYFRETYQACVERGFAAVLMEMDLEGAALEAGEVFKTVTDGSATGKRLQKIGYVDHAKRDLSKPRFAETVARNRGVNVRLFSDVAEAKRWMAEEA